MASSFTFDTDHKAAFGAQVLAVDWMVQLMLRQAEKGAEHARSIAPYDESRPPNELHYVDSIEADVYVRRVPGLDTPGPGRAVGRVTANDAIASIIEHGTRRTPAHRTLGRSLDAMRQM